MSNTGDRDGKATVELYAQTPYTDYDKQNNVEKSSIQLLGYDKIDVAAGASETVTVDVPGYFLASYDANGAKATSSMRAITTSPSATAHTRH